MNLMEEVQEQGLSMMNSKAKIKFKFLKIIQGHKLEQLCQK